MKKRQAKKIRQYTKYRVTIAPLKFPMISGKLNRRSREIMAWRVEWKASVKRLIRNLRKGI